MGVERAVTRWYVQHDVILKEISALEALLAQAASDETPENKVREQKKNDIEQQLTGARRKLHLLGPCPKPMMG